MRSSSLIAWYPLNEFSISGTTALDQSRNHNNGTITVGTGGLANGIHGQSNGAYDFDSANTKIDTGVDIIEILPLTISAWIYPDGWGEDGNLGRIIDNGKTKFYVSSSPRLNFTSDADVTNGNSLSAQLATGNWYFACVTRNLAGDETNFYVNGVLSGTANQNSGTPVAGTTNVFIGNSSIANRTFDGRLFDLRLYSYVMSAWQIKRLYDSYGV